MNQALTEHWLEAPLSGLLFAINQMVQNAAQTTAATVVNLITPLVALCFGIYVLLVCVSYLRGSLSDPVMDFGFRMAGGALVIGMGLHADQYVATIFPIVAGLGTDLASATLGSTSMGASLDSLALHYLRILDEGYQIANAAEPPFNSGPLTLYGLKVLCVVLGLVPGLVAASLASVLASVGAQLVAMLGPVFFAFLLFPVTRAYFSAWLNTALRFALMPLLVAVLAVPAVDLSRQMFMSTPSSGVLDDVSLQTVFLAAICNLVLLSLLRQVSSLAAALSAGGLRLASASSPGAHHGQRVSALPAGVGGHPLTSSFGSKRPG